MTSTNLPATGAADVWSVTDLSCWEILEPETQGSGTSRWVLEPSTGLRWLHKDTTIPSNGVEQGEDWAEVVSTQIATSLNVPRATARLCLCRGRRGSISLDLNQDASAFVHGGEWLEDTGVPDFDNWRQRPSRGRQRRSPGGTFQRGHSLTNIRQSLQDVQPPPGVPAGLTAFDVFAGYLVLDAIVANRDRHEFNWAVLRSVMRHEPHRLCPSFDHGATLGHNLTDERRAAWLPRVEDFAAQGTAHRFEHRRPPPTLVQIAGAALAMATPPGRSYWTEAVARFRFDRIRLDGPLPGMSELALVFARELVGINVRRVLDAIATG